MNEFKIISIEEFDADFVQNKRVKKSKPKAAPISLIPEMIKPEAKPAEPEEPIFTDEPTENIISDSPANEETINPEEEIPPKYFVKPSDDESDEDDDIEPAPPLTEKKKKNKKSGAGLLAGKIISIIFICITVVTFLLGCFVSIFLNNRAEAGGITFNTQLRDITIGDDTISEGSLIISKSISPDQYTENLNRPVSVPVDGKENEGCDIMYIYGAKDITIDYATVEVYDPVTNQISSRLYSHGEIFGIVTHYIPFIGNLLVFAINNAILVSALFVLMAAFWCMILILIIKNNKKA